MRVLVATDQWSPDDVGGSARVAADTAKSLAGRGHDVLVLAPSRSGLPKRTIEDGVHVVRSLSRHGVPQTFADPIVARRHARREARTTSFDVALAHQATNAAGLITGGVAPVAYVFHASAVLEARHDRTRSGLVTRASLTVLDPALAALERLALARARRVLVLSDFSAGLAVQRLPSVESRLCRVTGGVSREFFDPPSEPSEVVRRRHRVPDDAIMVLTARRLEPRMGLEELIRGVRSADELPLVLLLAGDGSLRGELDRLVTDLGLQARVRLLGRVSDLELRSLYAAADLFVLPTSAYEGFGMVTVEALAAGTPVLGTSVGATPEILADIDEALVVPHSSPDDLAAGLRRVAPLLCQDLRRRCAEAATRYRWDAAVVFWERALAAAAR